MCTGIVIMACSHPTRRCAPESRCGAETHIITFVTETPSVQTILEYIGEPASPPLVSPARAPPAGEDAPVELDPGDDPLAQPEPEYAFDQRVQW